MLRCLIDTNTLIDIVVAERPRHDDAVRIVALQKLGSAYSFGVFLPTLKDVYYVIERHYGDERFARKCVELLFEVFEPIPLDKRVFEKALSNDEPDLEDGFVRAAAEASGCDAIISRDARAFATSRCRGIEPCDLL